MTKIRLRPLNTFLKWKNLVPKVDDTRSSLYFSLGDIDIIEEMFDYFGKEHHGQRAPNGNGYIIDNYFFPVQTIESVGTNLTVRQLRDVIKGLDDGTEIRLDVPGAHDIAAKAAHYDKGWDVLIIESLEE